VEHRTPASGVRAARTLEREVRRLSWPQQLGAARLGAVEWVRFYFQVSTGAFAIPTVPKTRR
jgi:hypothetical protein